jgi:hypothetical protein
MSLESIVKKLRKYSVPIVVSLAIGLSSVYYVGPHVREYYKNWKNTQSDDKLLSESPEAPYVRAVGEAIAEHSERNNLLTFILNSPDAYLHYPPTSSFLGQFVGKDFPVPTYQLSLVDNNKMHNIAVYVVNPVTNRSYSLFGGNDFVENLPDSWIGKQGIILDDHYFGRGNWFDAAVIIFANNQESKESESSIKQKVNGYIQDLRKILNNP